MLDSGLRGHELASHPGAQEVSDERRADREAKQRAGVAANDGAGRVSDQIHHKQQQRQPVPPSRQTAQAPGRQGTRASDDEHEYGGPVTHSLKGGTGVWIETPHRVPRMPWCKERDRSDAGGESAHCKENAERDDAWCRTGHGIG